MFNSTHKVILATSSRHVFDLYKLNTQRDKKEDKDIIEIPQIAVSSHSKGDLKASLLILLKYCYSNQNFETIQDEITESNLFTVLSFAHCLKIQSLVDFLEKRIVSNSLNDNNAIQMIHEAQIVYI